MKPIATLCILCLLLAAMILEGCTSYVTIKNKPVDRRYEFHRSLAEPLSACVHEMYMEGGYSLRFHRNFDSRSQRWLLVGEATSALGSGLRLYLFSVSFRDTLKNTLVEVRWRGLWGELDAPKIAEYLSECAKSLADLNEKLERAKKPPAKS